MSTIHTIKQNNWQLTIDLIGGRIAELSYNDILILGTFERIDGKKGSTHLCLPNFSGEGMGEYGLPFHGRVRNSRWKLVVGRACRQAGSWETKSIDRAQVKLKCSIKRTEKYPADLLVTQQFELDAEKFAHTISVLHLGGVTVPVNIGVHNYWATPEGWKGLHINGDNVEEKIKTNGSIRLMDQNLIEFPGRKIKWVTKSFEDGVLWSACKGSQYDSSYVCIEPVLNFSHSPFSSHTLNLKRNETIVVVQKIYCPVLI